MIIVLSQEPNGVGQGQQLFCRAIANLHPNKLGLRRHTLFNPYAIFNGSIVEVPLIRYEASLELRQPLSHQYCAGTFRARPELITNLRRSVQLGNAHLKRKIHARSSDQIGPAGLDTLHNGSLATAPGLDDGGRPPVQRRGRVRVAASDSGQELPLYKQFMPLLDGLLILSVPQSVPDLYRVSLLPPETPVTRRARGKGVIGRDEATHAVDLVRGGSEARVVIGLVPPLDDLAAVEADGLPVAEAGGDLDGAADEQIRGEIGLVGADDLVAAVGVVVAEEDEGEILGQGVANLLVRRVSAVRVDGVHVEVAAHPGERRVFLAAVADGVETGGGVVGREPRVNGVEGHFDIELPVDTLWDGCVRAQDDVPGAWFDGAGVVARGGPGGSDGEVVSEPAGPASRAGGATLSVHHLVSSLVEDSQIKGIPLPLLRVALHNIDGCCPDFHFEWHVDKGVDLGGVNMTGQSLLDGFSSSGKLQERKQPGNSTDTLHLADLLLSRESLLRCRDWASFIQIPNKMAIGVPRTWPSISPDSAIHLARLGEDSVVKQAHVPTSPHVNFHVCA
jgi:hypothetical protein